MKKISILLLLLMVAAPSLLKGQTFSLVNGRIAITHLDGRWRFHAGDDPTWAHPDYDDSSWSLLDSFRGWNSQGYRGYSGLAWYRFTVYLPASMQEITLDLPHILTCYQLFANGQLIGTYGKMPPEPVPYSGGFNRLYKIPKEIGTYIPASGSAPAQRKITFAIRVWHWKALSAFYGGGPLYGDGLIGASSEINLYDKQLEGYRHWVFNSTLILALLQTLAALGSLSLFLLRRSDREYLWFSLVLLSSAGVSWLGLFYYFEVWPLIPHNLIEATLVGPCINLSEIGFYFYLLKGKRTRFFWIAIWASVASIAYNLIFGREGSNTASWYLGQDLLMLPSWLWMLTLLFTRARQRNEDARVLMPPVLLQKASLLFQQIMILTFTLGWQSRWDFRIWLTDWPFRIELVQIVDALVLFSVLAILILHFTRTRTHEERYATEVEGARSVQQFLIPHQMPSIPGLLFESEYRPAREVGGDFFQIIPGGLENGTLVVIGDVAGKGLQAGMLATLLVGALRTAATFTTDPVKILATLNNRLCGRGNATCIVLSIGIDGQVKLVNAGHLPPYLNGRELPVEGALPLGTIRDLHFPVLRFQLAEGDSLMLMSDGIAEAQNYDRQLFGFDRVREMLAQHATAETLAIAAERFGQTDDITVLNIARTAVVVQTVSLAV